MVILYDFATYTVRADDCGGLLLTNDALGAEKYFQPGDDAAALRDECERLYAPLTDPAADKHLGELIACSVLAEYF